MTPVAGIRSLLKNCQSSSECGLRGLYRRKGVARETVNEMMMWKAFGAPQLIFLSPGGHSYNYYYRDYESFMKKGRRGGEKDRQ